MDLGIPTSSNEAREWIRIGQPIISSEAILMHICQPNNSNEARSLMDIGQPNTSSEARGLRDLDQSTSSSEAGGLKKFG